MTSHVCVLIVLPHGHCFLEGNPGIQKQWPGMKNWEIMPYFSQQNHHRKDISSQVAEKSKHRALI